MDPLSAKYLAIAIVVGLGTISSGFGEGYVSGKAMEAMGRNPEAAGALFTRLIVAMAIVESTSIYGLVVGLILLFAK